MTTEAFHPLTCPLDAQLLQRTGAAWCCPEGHAFDIARDGYVNLLPVQHKRSRDPGDGKAMVAARRRFLNSGIYAPIAEALARQALAEGDDPLACLDAGCGEGYYLRCLSTQAGARGLRLIGLDISKWAVQAAARQDARPAWVVGSNAKLPVPAGRLDRILCLFGFPVYSEFARGLKPGGLLLQVDVGDEHLRELREIIYPALKAPRPAASDAPPGFLPQTTQNLRYTAHLADQSMIADLLLMTPHLYKATQAGRGRAAALPALAVTVDVRINVLRRLG